MAQGPSGAYGRRVSAQRDQPIDAAAIAGVFTSGVLRELARRGRSPRFANIAAQSGVATALAPDALVREVFDLALVSLERETDRGAYPYRAAIARKLFREKHKIESATLLAEFRVGSARADAVVLNGKATVYEIKSERDNVGRLAEQLDQYARVFPNVRVVAAERHVDAVMRIADSSIGVISLSKKLTLHTVRAGADDRSRLSVTHIFDSLQRAEAIAILRRYGIAIPELPNTAMHGALRKLFATLTADQAHRGMLATLKKTRSLASRARALEQLPASLYAAAITMPFQRSELRRLVASMDTPFEEASRWT